MPNPRAQKPLTLDQAVSDIKSLAQPAQALGDMMASTLRGSVAATAGLPGDVRELIDLFGPEAVERVLGKRVMPTTEEMKQILPKATNYENPYESLGEFLPLPGTGTALKAARYGAGRGTGALTRTAGQAISDAMIHQAGPLASGPLSALAPRAAMTNVVKPKGGNWLAGSVENVTKPLKSKVTTENFVNYTPEQVQQMVGSDRLKRNDAINQWIDRNLTNYIKKEMATPEDPVRKMAEEGITHMPPEQMGYGPSSAEDAQKARERHNAPRLGKSPEAQAWEDATDQAMYSHTIGELNKVREAGGPHDKSWFEPWMEKADPETKVWKPLQSMRSNMLGFDHIVDVLKQDLAEGRIRPEQLSKVSMEQAVRRTYEYDQEMARKMAEAAIKQQEGFPLHKEYPEGYKWIELARPKDLTELPEGYTAQPYKSQYSEGVKILNPKGEQVSAGDTLDEALKNMSEARLEEALKYEGDTMGHCVGGYCPDVLEGRTRIFSLRDKKGEPHVTVEVQPNPQPYPVSGEAFARLTPAERAQYREYVMQWRRRNPDIEELTDEHTAQALREAGLPPQPDRIVQIKGKQNAAPKADYLPYVQDFVRSGEWSDVGDIQNTGLIRRGNVFSPTEKQGLIDLGQDVPEYLTQEDIAKLRRARGDLPPEEGMAAGGKPRYPTEQEREAMRKLRESFVPAATEAERLKRLYDNMDKSSKKVSFSDNPDAMMMEMGDVHMAGGGDVRGYDNGGSIKATPRSEGWGTAADIAKAVEDLSKEQFGYKNPATEAIAEFLGIPAVARTLERKAYGEPVTNIGKANVPLLPDDTAEAAMTVAPLAGKAAKGAKALGKAGLSEVEKAMFGESSSKLLNAATPQVMSVYRPHTPSKPDPEVGTRYKKQYVGGLAPRKDLDIQDLEKSNVKIFPWDATSRNQLITEVSEVPLTKPVLTEGGDEYMLDLEHIKNRIAGASNEGIAKRIKDRIDQAAVENRMLGGTGKVYGFPIRMGESAENAATFPTDVAMDLLKQGKLKKSELKELDSSLRNMVFEGDKGVFKNMAPIGTPEFEQQLRTGLKGDKAKDIQGFTAMNLRKGLMDRLGLVGYQKRLGYNLPDLTGAVLSDELKGVPKGYVGNVAAELDPFVDIRPSKSSTYSHDFSGQYAGSMPNMPVEFLMPNTYESIYRELKAKYPKFSPEALRNMTIGAMEKRKDKISEFISPRAVDATKMYQEGLMQGEFDPYDIKQVYEYMKRKKMGLKLKDGGEIHVKPKKMAGGGEITAEDLEIEERPL